MIGSLRKVYGAAGDGLTSGRMKCFKIHVSWPEASRFAVKAEHLPALEKIRQPAVAQHLFISLRGFLEVESRRLFTISPQLEALALLASEQVRHTRAAFLPETVILLSRSAFRSSSREALSSGKGERNSRVTPQSLADVSSPFFEEEACFPCSLTDSTRCARGTSPA